MDTPDSPYWLPTPATRLGVPSVVGPVGGAVTTPRPLLDLLGRRGRITEWVDKWSVRILENLAVTRRTWRSASVMMVQNTETFERTKALTRQTPIIFNHAVFHVVDAPHIEPAESTGGYVIWLSPMDSRKGPELAIRALAATDSSIRLVMVGDGPELTRMKRLSDRLGLENRVEFLDRVDHDRALSLIAGARAALFTGLREEGGHALTEALYIGTPTIVLDHGGPAVIAQAAALPARITLVTIQSKKQSIDELSGAISATADIPHSQRTPILDRAAFISQMGDVYTGVLDSRERGNPQNRVRPIPQPTGQPQPGGTAISIVMPAYNAERFIREAIDSVLNQTHTDFELIIVDDGSTDHTWEIVQECEALDERVISLQNESNLGIVRTLNRGIELARAELIGRLDADDIAVADRFERQLRVLSDHPEVVVVGSNALHINEAGEVLGLSIAGPESIDEFHRMRVAGEITMVLDGTSLFRRDAFDLAGQYRSATDAAPEVDLHSRMAGYGAIVSIQDPLLMYRLHTGSNVVTTFFDGREIHRFVASCEQARLRGEARPSLAEFRAQEAAAPTWHRARIRMKDTGQFRYRSAGVHLSEGKTIAGISDLGRAFVLSPRFVVTRLWKRRISPTARRAMHDAQAGPRS